ncbi:MAG: hypothetical protein HY323_08045 [Betaproteobacteria bacterium]|nr:hypothetical protein [Betaproteobacteria bacterium]
MNSAPNDFAKRSDAHFEMHHASVRANAYTTPGEQVYLSKLPELAQKMPLYMLDGEIPSARRYPIELVVAHFGRAYFTSSCAYMLALAIYEAEKHPDLYQKVIGVWGVDLVHHAEYARERACVEWWLCKAEDRGFQLVLPAGSPLLRSEYLYGYSDPELERRKQQIQGRQKTIEEWVRQTEANLRQQKLALEEAQKTVEATKRQLAVFEGMYRETEWAAQTWTDAIPSGTAPRM